MWCCDGGKEKKLGAHLLVLFVCMLGWLEHPRSSTKPRLLKVRDAKRSERDFQLHNGLEETLRSDSKVF